MTRMLSCRLKRQTAMALTILALAASGAGGRAAATELELPTYQLQEGFGVWWQAAAEEFAKENPGDTIKLIGVPYAQHHDQLTTRFVAGNPPDIAHISARFFFGYADQGFLEPLDDRLAAIGWKEEDFIGAQKQMRRDGKVYGQLLLGYGWGLFYNADYLQKAGIAVPKTADELLQAAHALTVDSDGDGRIDQYGMAVATSQGSETYMYLTYFLAGLGHGWVENGELVAPEHLRAALALVDDLVTSKATPVGLNSSAMRQLFWQGKAAMYIDGSWAPAYKKDSPPEVKAAYRVAPLPVPDEAGGPSNVLAIPAALPEDRKALAFKFIELIQRPEWQQRYAEMSGNPPARLGSLTDKARQDWPEIPVFEASMSRAGQSYLPVGYEGDFAKWSNIVAEGVTGMVSGALTLDEATAQIHDELSREFF